MSDHTSAVPVELTDPVELLEAQPSRVQLWAVAGIVAGLLIGLLGIIVLSYVGRDTPDVLDVTLGTLAGALAGMLVQRRG